MGLGDVTNGIGAQVQKLGKIGAHKELENCYRFYEYYEYYFKYTIILDILSSIHVPDGDEVETLI